MDNEKYVSHYYGILYRHNHNQVKCFLLNCVLEIDQIPFELDILIFWKNIFLKGYSISKNNNLFLKIDQIDKIF